MVVPRSVIVMKLVIHGVHGLFDGHLTWCLTFGSIGMM